MADNKPKKAQRFICRHYSISIQTNSIRPSICYCQKCGQEFKVPVLEPIDAGVPNDARDRCREALQPE